jgi:hypothetical protein
MEIKGKRVLDLYLTDWQRKMVKDFLGVDCYYWTVRLSNNPTVRYGVRIPENPRVKRMYLTDWQKREIMDETGESCNFIELKGGIMPDYGVPPEEL